MSRAIVCLLAAAWVLEPGVTAAAPTHPCDIALSAPGVAELAARLARSNDPEAWRAVGATARALAEAGSELSDADRGCAAYVAGSAAFFLSADRGTRRAEAARAVAAFALAERLAPAAMTGRQARNRLQTAWRRMGAVAGWLTGERPVRVSVSPPSAIGAGQLRFTPSTPGAWSQVCPEDRCGPFPAITVPHPEAGLGTFSLRPGAYTVERLAACGATRAAVTVDRAGPIELPPPAPCLARLEVRDARDGDGPPPTVTVRGSDGVILDAGAVPVERAPVKVSAPGYQPLTVELPSRGGPAAVALERCPVKLVVLTQPEGARIEGDGPGPWGARVVRARKAGHGPIEVTVEVPPPDACDAEADSISTHTAQLVLPRSVTVQARGPAGDALTLGKLVVQGEPVDAMGFHRPPGRYAWQAMHAQYGVTTGQVEVGPCLANDCSPVVLTVRFARPEAERSRGPLLVMGAGGIVFGLGALAGVAAWQTNQDIRSYSTKAEVGVPLEDLVARRDDQALTADGLMLTGVVTAAVGALWWLAEGE